LASDVKETGCSVHRVVEEVDAGEVVKQKTCTVEREGKRQDSVETLKMKVQALEGAALVELLVELRGRGKEHKEGLSYKDSGVDVTMGNDFVDVLKPLAAATKRAGFYRVRWIYEEIDTDSSDFRHGRGPWWVWRSL
jgi:methionyl-tRNA formyltransferase